MALIHEDRRGLTSSMTPEEVRQLGIEGLLLLDLRLCQGDSETIAANRNLVDVAAWVPEGTQREWVLSWASAEQREDRIAGMKELAEAGEWHDLSCHLIGWHDGLLALNAIYGRWAADAPRRNASKPRQKKDHWRALADHLNKHGAETRHDKYFDIPQDNHQDPLALSNGRFEFSRRIGHGKPDTSEKRVRLIRCVFDDGTVPDEIAFSTFVKYLKSPQAAKKSGAVSR